MTWLIGVAFAACAAASNAAGTVFQRKAAREAPPEETMRLALLVDLLRRPVWLLGISGMIAGFVFQATALHFAELSVVQPIVVGELPLTVAIAALVFHARMEPGAVWATVAVSAGVALVIFATAPEREHIHTDSLTWLVAGVVTVGVVVTLVVAGLRASASRRAALFGAAAGIGFGFTAALMNGAVHQVTHGWVALFTTWQVYAMALAGICSVFLAQNALQAGPIVAAQPPITTLDPVASVCYGVFVFGEQLRGGIWLIPALAGAAVGVTGVVLLSRSPVMSLQGQDARLDGSPAATSRPDSQDAGH